MSTTHDLDCRCVWCICTCGQPKAQGHAVCASCREPRPEPDPIEAFGAQFEALAQRGRFQNDESEDELPPRIEPPNWTLTCLSCGRSQDVVALTVVKGRRCLTCGGSVEVEPYTVPVG